jgi:hypothetical protein
MIRFGACFASVQCFVVSAGVSAAARLAHTVPEQKSAHARQAADVAAQRQSASKDKLRSALVETRRIVDLHDSLQQQQHVPRREATLHQLRTSLQTVALRLTPREFALATTKQLFELLKVCRVQNASGAVHVASLALKVLVDERLPAMDAKDTARSVLFLARNRRDLPHSALARAMTASVHKLLTSDREHIAAIPLDRLVSLLSMMRTTALVPEGHAREFLAQAVDVLPLHKHELRPKHVAAVCQCITYFRYADQACVDFFVEAVDVCLANLVDVSPKDASYVLDAFASVKYTPTRLFLELGQIAGDNAETLDESDVARIVNAFRKTAIDFKGLEESLQGTMRLKSLEGKDGLMRRRMKRSKS